MKAGSPTRHCCSPNSVNLCEFTNSSYGLNTKDQIWWPLFKTIDDESKIFCLLPLRIHAVRMSFLHSGAIGGGRGREHSHFTTRGIMAGKSSGRSLFLFFLMSRDIE